MKKIIISSLLAVLFVQVSTAQRRDIDENSYRRSSLYSLLISHTDQKFNAEIQNVFLEIPIPDTYNDHDLSVKIVSLEEKIKKDQQSKSDAAPMGPEKVTKFLEDNQIASRLIGRWFMRDYNTGECSMDLVKDRGLYAASEIDRIKASNNLRGEALLADAGEDLIQNTFVLVNDVVYVDKAQRAKVWGGLLKAFGTVVSAATGTDITDLTDRVGNMIETIKGFSVKVHTFLYQLEWDEEIAAITYDNWNNRDAFEANRGRYRLKYIGDQNSKGATASFMGIREDQPEVMIRKACQRALDENIANLQQNFQSFQIKTPLENVEPLKARVGKKEGITEESRFEVLEPRKNEATGRISYKKVGEIKPIPNLIWDNRYMAVEEMAEGANLGYTTFKKVSGGKFMPGYLIRQIK